MTRILGVIGPWQIIIVLAFMGLICFVLYCLFKPHHIMKYCPKCGNAVPEEASFCPKCGTNFPDAAAPTPLSQNYQQPSVPPCPPTYLALSIIVTALCCLPFGIVGIVKSSSVSREYAIGNYAAAQDASNQAKKWSIIGICCSLFWIILYIILLACGFMAGLADL